MTEHVLIEKSNGVLTLTLNRPDKKNALTNEMYAALGDSIDNAADDPDVRCVLIQANGDMFTAGNDLASFQAINTGATPQGERRGGSALIQALGRAKTPVIAAVNGRAVGVGTTMLLHCDLVYVAEDALLTTPFVNLALVPEAASSLQLPARIGHARAFAMFVLGEAVDAKKAVEWGIANEVVPLAELRAKARAAAEAVASKPPSAVAATKALMRDPERLLAQMEREGALFGAQLKSAEAAEAFAAFRERRAPDFSKVA